MKLINKHTEKFSRKKVEAEVRKNSELVEKLIPELIEKHKDKYVLFYEGYEPLIFSKFGTAVEKGLKIYGIHSGFVVKQITTQPIRISSQWL